MGDRIVYTMKQADGYAINLYSHWGGYERFKDLANALEKARPRWSDENYCARIIVSQLIADSWDHETGWGLWASNEEGGGIMGDHQDIIIDLVDKTVSDETGIHSFDSFVNFHGVPVDLTEQRSMQGSTGSAGVSAGVVACTPPLSLV